jgi:hypothetical protein
MSFLEDKKDVDRIFDESKIGYHIDARFDAKAIAARKQSDIAVILQLLAKNYSMRMTEVLANIAMQYPLTQYQRSEMAETVLSKVKVFSGSTDDEACLGRIILLTLGRDLEKRIFKKVTVLAQSPSVLGYLKYSLRFVIERSEVDEKLQQHGIDYTIAESEGGDGSGRGRRWEDVKQHAADLPVLFDLLRQPFTAQMHCIVARMISRYNLGLNQRQAFFHHLLDRVARFDGSREEDLFLSMIVLNELSQNADAACASEVGKMALDDRFGIHVRQSLPEVLFLMRTDEALSYLRRITEDPQRVAMVVQDLAKWKPLEAVELCKRALKDSRTAHKDIIREVLAKHQRQGGKKQPKLDHATKAAIPTGLNEWSTNLDAPQLPTALRAVQKTVSTGFGTMEIAEVRAGADQLEPDETVRFRFPVKIGTDNYALWIEIFCDDEDAFDLYVFGDKTVIQALEKATKVVLK